MRILGTHNPCGGTISFRFESAADISTRFVPKLDNSAGAPCGGRADVDVFPLQTHGHLLLSGFRIADPGSCRVFSYRADNTSGTATHVADAMVTMGQ